MQTRYDVVIAGGGTAGLYMAYMLAKFGFSVLVVEQKPLDNLFKVTGDAIGKHHVQQHIPDLPQDVIVNYYRGALVISPEEDITIEVPGEGYALDISRWLRELARRAINAGAEIADSSSVVKPIYENGQVTGVVVSRKDGTHAQVQAQVTVDATGASGAVRTKLPKELPISEPLAPQDASYAFREIVELEHDIERQDFIRIYLDQRIAPGGYWWFFPKSQRVANVGLGIWGKHVRELGYNPARFYERLVKARPELSNRKILHSGGGIVPTRRPLDTLVWNRFLAIGDAACAVNPVHGGGLGPALLSAKLASETLALAFEKGDLSVRGLWSYNIRYIQAYGLKQAKLDIFRLALQHMSNEELEAGLRAKLVESQDVLSLSSEGREQSLLHRIKLVFKLVRLPLSLIRKLALAVSYMRKIENLYRTYPENPEKLDIWRAQVRKLYEEYLRKLQTLTETR